MNGRRNASSAGLFAPPLALAGLLGAAAAAAEGLPRGAVRPSTENPFARAVGAPAAEGAAGELVALRPAASDRVLIAGGTFTMGSSRDEMAAAVTMCRREVVDSLCDRVASRFRAEAIAHRVTVSPFRIDRWEVTVAAYRRCVVAGSCAPPHFAVGDAHFDAPDLPVTHIGRNDAAAYCGFVGGRLPTEAEWEFAARGTTGRRFPWGSAWDGALANHGALSREEGDDEDGFLRLAPIGRFRGGRTPEGVEDLAGNVSEFVEDTFEVDDEGYGYAGAATTNPRASGRGGPPVVRGGSFRDAAPFQRSAFRGYLVAPYAPTVGVRCVYPTGDPPAPTPAPALR